MTNQILEYDMRMIVLEQIKVQYPFFMNWANVKIYPSGSHNGKPDQFPKVLKKKKKN